MKNESMEAAKLRGTVKYYRARRDTRWDVYPQQAIAEIVAYDGYTIWACTTEGIWFKAPSGYVLMEGRGADTAQALADTMFQNIKQHTKEA
jgi:hypothetical protein